MPSIKSRITSLADALERRRQFEAEPLDPLSASLYEWERGLSTLDEQGKAALLEELNQDGLGLDMADLERMIEEAAR